MKLKSMPYSDWLAILSAFFEQEEEFSLARAIYEFQTNWEDGMTPKQAYEAFDRWARQDAA